MLGGHGCHGGRLFDETDERNVPVERDAGKLLGSP